MGALTLLDANGAVEGLADEADVFEILEASAWTPDNGTVICLHVGYTGGLTIATAAEIGGITRAACDDAAGAYSCSELVSAGGLYDDATSWSRTTLTPDGALWTVADAGLIAVLAAMFGFDAANGHLYLAKLRRLATGHDYHFCLFYDYCA
ncbi:MAG TPA: hypothetical protein VFG73_02285 [Rhodanobacteraceae bacterium]|nr:hypothetical protein [Rhodanobacteraceae bacterium]